MEKDFWLERWRIGQTGFHQNKIMPLLQKHWPQLGVKPPAKVLVPLAGKTLDIIWFEQLGYEVVAIELSAIAIQQFFNEHNIDPSINKQGKFTIYKSGKITFICGDIFDLEPSFFNDFQACYDRAALIALPPEMRQQYAKHVYGNLPSGCKTLLLTIDYDQSEMQGPPFSVNAADIKQLFANSQSIQLLENRDVLANETKFKERGLSSMFTEVHLMKKQA